MLILGSNSPRRRELLALTGWDFKIYPADVDERQVDGELAQDYVNRLAQVKAQAVVGHASIEDIIIAADTTVVDEEKILGKPADNFEAELMLRGLRARTHQVYTALAMFRVADSRMISDWCITDVPMRDYSDEEMQAYIATGDPLDKAGAYAIQHDGFSPVENLVGCYANVVGLPLCHLTRSLRRFDVTPSVDIPQACQARLGYNCPIHQQVLGREY